MDVHRFRSLGAILVALALSGCWTQLGAGPANTRFNDAEDQITSDNVDSLAVDWRTPIDEIMTEPIASGGRVHVTTWRESDDGPFVDSLMVRTYDSDTGAEVWQRQLLPGGITEGNGTVETPALAGGALWVPYFHDSMGCQGRLARLDPATGAVLSTDVIGSHPSSVVVADGFVTYTVGSCSGGIRLVVRDQATRAIRWTHQFPAGSSIVAPTVAGGRIFLLADDTIYAFTAAGCGASTCGPTWTEPVAGTFFDFQRLVAGPGDNLVTVGQSSDPERGATVVVRDQATGDVRWEAEPRYTGQLPGAITGIAVAYDTIYVAGATGPSGETPGQAILDAYPGGGCGQAVCSPAWTSELGLAGRPAREPSVAGGVVYVPMVAGIETSPALVAVDAHGCGSSTCGELGRVPFVTSGSFFHEQAQPYATSVADGRVMVAWLPGLHGPTLSQLISLSLPGS